MSIEAMKLALEAFKKTHYALIDAGLLDQVRLDENFTAAEALRQAIEQEEAKNCKNCIINKPCSCKGKDMQICGAFVSSIEQAQKQEPVAWRFTGIAGLKRFMTQKQYDAQTPETKKWYEPYRCANCASPPQRQPLTDEQIVAINDKHYNLAYRDFDADIAIARAIEAAHGIKE